MGFRLGTGRIAGPVVSIVVVAVMAHQAAVAGDPHHFGNEDWRRAVAAKGLDPANVIYPFESDETMREWTAQRLTGYENIGASKQLEILQQELFNDDAFEFAYQDAVTLDARAAFEARRGNCMAFTSLFIALSRSVGIPTFLVLVRRAPDVDRDESLVVVNRHVVAGYRGSNEVSLYDFYVRSATPYAQTRILDDVQASALFHTNLGGTAIREGELETARYHLSLATVLDPEWAPGWVNLGVTRFRLGDASGAMEAHRRALEIEPGNSSALTNMAVVYRSQGREDEARAALKAAAEGRANPFTLVAMADIEMGRGDLDAAAGYLRRARWWYQDEPEVFDAMARLARREGRPKKADRYAEKAAELRLERLAEEEATRDAS